MRGYYKCPCCGKTKLLFRAPGPIYCDRCIQSGKRVLMAWVDDDCR